MANLTIPLIMANILHLALSLVVLLWLARIVTLFAGRINTPPVLAEIFLGILIGPTFLGMVFPAVSEWLFPVTGDTGAALKQLSHFAVVMLLFVAGMETDLKALRTEGGKIIPTAMGGAMIPFVAGFLLVMLSPALFGVTAQSQQHLLLACFFGIALGISALPDYGCLRKRNGYFRLDGLYRPALLA